MSDIRREDGGVLVASAIIIVALVFLSIGVIQVGAWFQDRRHLQVRADAGALAGGQLFNECFNTDAFTPAVAKADMEKAASQYAGFSSYNGTPLAGSFTPAYNTSFASGSNAIAFQSKTYPGGGGSGPDDTNTSNECDSSNLALDVKLTRDVGGTFTISPLAHVHAHARVQLKEVQSVVPTFPLAVPELVPGAVAVTFVNEDTDVELSGCSGPGFVSGCTFKLTNTNAPGTDPFNLGPWTDNGASVALPAFAVGDTTTTAKHIGMRIGIGDPSAVQSCAGSGNGTTWVCFNASSSNGAVMIDEVNPSLGAFPKLQGVWPTTCAGSPFAGDESLPAPCAATLTAKIAFDPAQDLSKTDVQATLTQTGGSTQTFNLTRDTTTGLWSAPLSTTTSAVTVDSATGGSEYSIDLCWRPKSGKYTCPGDWAGIQRLVGATNTDDGPLDAVSLADASAPNGPYSYSGGGSHSLNISVLLKAPFNKLTILRQAHSGSATAFILCRWKGAPPAIENGAPGITDALEQGCQVPYQVNATASCSPDPLPAPENGLIPDCTQNKPSSSMGNQITKSLDIRFGCKKNQTPDHPNLWPNYSTPGDTRAVTLVTTTYDAFAHNGSQAYPVAGFGAFYIAGVSGNACGDDWPLDPVTHQPILGTEPDKNSGTIWGYFIKYSNNDGTPSGRACKLNSLNNCVAVLTR